MNLKENVQITFFCLSACNNLGKKILKKKFSSFSGGLALLIQENGLIGTSFFFRPYKMFSYFKFIYFFLLDTLIKLKKRRKRKNHQAKDIRSTINRNNFFSKDFFLNPNKIGQLVFMEGVVLSLTPPMAKKIERPNLLFSSFYHTHRNYLPLYKNSGIDPLKEENLKKSSENRVDYQEAKLFSFNKKKPEKNSGNFFFTKICLTENLVKNFDTGNSISIWGFVKNRFLLNSDTVQGLSGDLFLNAFLVKKKKKKEIKKNLSKKKGIKLIDSVIHFQDSKIRGGCVFKRNYTLFHLFPKKNFSLIFKLSILLSLMGGVSRELSSGQKRRINFCLIGKSEAEKNLVLKNLKKFWRNSIFFSFNSLGNTEIFDYQFRIFSEKKENLELVSKSLSEMGVIFLDLIGHQEPLKTKLISKLFEQFSKISWLNPTVPGPVLFFSGENGEKFYNDLSKSGQFSSHLVSKLFFSKLKKSKVQGFFDILFFFTGNEKRNTKKKGFFKSVDHYRETFNEKFISLSFSLRNGFRKWSNCNFKQYFLYIKSYFEPKLSKQAEKFLLSWYKSQVAKKNFQGEEIIILEKLIRISEAHARILFQDFVLVNDCVLASFLIHQSFLCYDLIENWNSHFDLLDLNLNFFFSVKEPFYSFLLKDFRILSGLKGLAGGTVRG